MPEHNLTSSGSSETQTPETTNVTPTQEWDLETPVWVENVHEFARTFDDFCEIVALCDLDPAEVELELLEPAGYPMLDIYDFLGPYVVYIDPCVEVDEQFPEIVSAIDHLNELVQKAAEKEPFSWKGTGVRVTLSSETIETLRAELAHEAS